MMKTDYIEIQLPEGSNLTKVPMTMLERRRLLCDDLEYCVLEDKDLLATIIDEFVYHLSDKEVKDYEDICSVMLGQG